MLHKYLCQHNIFLLCGQKLVWCVSIYLDCSQVDLRTNNSIPEMNNNIKSIDTTMITIYFKLRLRNEIRFHLLLTCGMQYNSLHLNNVYLKKMHLSRSLCYFLNLICLT